MTATLQTSIVQNAASSTPNITLDTNGGASVGQNLSVTGTTTFAGQATLNVSPILKGSTSGQLTVAAPAIAGTSTVTFPAGTGTIAVQGSSTNIVQGTSVASTSGTSISFTNLPSWARRITLMLNGVATSGSSLMIVQLGTSGGFVTTGYVGGSWQSNTSNQSYSTGFLIDAAGNTSYVWSGLFTLCLQDLPSNTWASSSVFGESTSNNASHGGGVKALSGTLTQIRLTTVNGTDTFRAGSINILYE